MLSLGRSFRSAWIAIVVSGWVTQASTAWAGESFQQVRIRDGFAAAAVRRALRGARQQLADPKCRRIFGDFATAEGRALQSILDDLGQAPQDYLGTVLFYDGSEQPGCAAKKIGAITSPGTHVVFVCAANLRKLPGTQVEALILHEMLHSLGLGENPPSASDITARVVARCGL